MAVTEILSAIVSIVCAMAIFMLQRKQRMRDAAADRQAEARQQESRLMLSMIMANNRMSYATAIAVRDGKTNGEMADAVRDYSETRRDYLDFINNYAITRLSGEK